LTPAEQRVLKQMLDVLCAPLPELTEKSDSQKLQELDQILLEEGLVSQIPPPITDFTPYRNRKLIEVKGKPISQTIIEERR
jgi:hypothetical protein